MPHFIFMRGLPGSGKSTLAHAIAQAEGGHVFSADDFFADEDGVYRFDGRRIRDAHDDTRRRIDAVAALGARLIIIDNTSLRMADMIEYLRLAARHGAEVSTRVPNTPWVWNVEECARRTVHGLSAETIAMLARRWEEIGDEQLRKLAGQLGNREAME